MQKDDGNPSGGARRPESDERLADNGKREAQGRRPRRGTRRTDGPLGKHESKNTKKMIAAQAIDPAKDIAASRERMVWEDARAKRAADARVDAAAGAGAASAAGAEGVASAKAVAAVDHETALAKSEAAYGVRQNAATYDDVREAKAARGAKHGTSRPDARVARGGAGREDRDGRGGRGGRDGREEKASAGERVAAARERAASGAQTARERATSAGEWAAAHRRLWIVLAVVVAVAAALYGPAQRYYVSMRTTQDLQVKYAALKSQNKDLKSDVDTLMSKEGIEDQARKNGYVYPGEKGVEVKGLKEDGKDPSAAITYKDDRAWYTKVLDALFGYDRKTVLK